MNTKNNRRAKDSRQRIGQALLALLKKQDILDVTVSGLCAAAGVNRSTFYSHYDGVADVMEALMRETAQDLFTRFSPENYDPLHPFSLEHLAVVLGHIRDNQVFYRAYLAQSTAQRQIDWAFGQLLEQFVRPMLRGMQVEDRATEYYFAFFRGGFTAAIVHWLQTGCRETPETVAAYIRNSLNHPQFTL